MKRKQFWKKILAGVLLLVVTVMIVGAVYAGQYYKPEANAELAAITMKDESGDLVLNGDNGKGIVIYPGGKVDERAYAYLARRLYEEGYTVIIAKMPFRLSIISSYRAKEIIEVHTDISEWYIAGHSLGGTSAGMCVEKYPELFDGVIFMGSYAYPDLRAYRGKVLVIDAEHDEVLDRAAFEAAADNHPGQTVFFTIEGGNHSGFGDYGQQKGDGEAAISMQEQHREIVEQIVLLTE